MPTDRSCRCAAKHPRQGDPSPHALIADPDESVHHALRPLLAAEGLGCQVVATFAAGVRRCAGGLPTVLIAAAALPDGSGYALVDHLRRQDGGHRSAALVLRPPGGGSGGNVAR